MLGSDNYEFTVNLIRWMKIEFTETLVELTKDVDDHAIALPVVQPTVTQAKYPAISGDITYDFTIEE